jgi:cytochrome c-type biogenesis protein CcmH
MKLAVILLASLVLAAPAAASERHPTLAELENEVMCPTCHTVLAQSHSPAADQIRRVILSRIKAGDTKSEIKSLLVDQYGESILAAPPKHGFDLLAWLLPLVGILGGAAALAVLAWRWSRGREPTVTLPPGALNGRPLDADLERRLDEELARFDA